jgi:hypothetical protein
LLRLAERRTEVVKRLPNPFSLRGERLKFHSIDNRRQIVCRSKARGYHDEKSHKERACAHHESSSSEHQKNSTSGELTEGHASL